MTVVLHGLDGLREAAGTHLGTSEWLTVDQATIDRFADATGDHNWILVDPVRAADHSPVGRTIAHGYGTLALIPVLFESMLSVRDIGVQLLLAFVVDIEDQPKPACVAEAVFRYYAGASTS